MCLDAALGSLSSEERKILVKHLIHRLTNAISPLDIRLQLPVPDGIAGEPMHKDAVFAVEKIKELAEQLRASAGMEPPERE